MRHSQIACQNEQLLLKKLFYSMFSLESDKISALWPYDFLTFTSLNVYIPNWESFVKEVFWFDD